MNSRISLIALVGLMATLLVGVSVFQGHPSGIVAQVHAQENDEQKGCSNATLSGTYGFYRTGTSSVGPLAAVGLDVLAEGLSEVMGRERQLTWHLALHRPHGP